MKRTRGVLRAAVACSAVGLLVACSGGTSATGERDDNGDGESAAAVLDGIGDATGEIRLSWWGGETRNAKTNAVADMFEEDFPEVTVQRETTDFGSYWDRLNVQAAGSDMPCVTQTQARQLNDFTSRNVLLPLDPMIESGAIDVTDISEDILDAGRGPDGNIYMLPYGAAYDALMVNVTLAEQAGVGVPPEGYTWEDFVAWGNDAVAGMPEGISAMNLGGGLPNYFIGYVESQGEDMFAEGQLGFEKDLLIEYWTLWKGLQDAGVTITPEQRAEEPTQPEASYIATGRVMADNRPGNALTPAQGTLDGTGSGQQLTTVPLPAGPAGSGNVIIASGFSIPVNCENIPTAAAFINFWLNDDDAAAEFASDNGAVTNARHLQAQLDDPDLPELKLHELELFQKVVELGPPAVIYPPGYQATFESAFIRAWDEVAFGRTTVEASVDAFFEEANAGLS